MLKPHQERVVDEFTALDEKTRKLLSFIDSPVFASLETEEQDRLKLQVLTMQIYCKILQSRIAYFGRVNNAS